MLGASRYDVSALKSVMLAQTRPGTFLGTYQEVQKKTPRESLIGSLVPTLNISCLKTRLTSILWSTGSGVIDEWNDLASQSLEDEDLIKSSESDPV